MVKWMRPEGGKVGRRRLALYLERGRCNFLLAMIVITPQSFVRKERKKSSLQFPLPADRRHSAVRHRRRRRRVIYCSPVLMSKTTLRLLGGQLERAAVQLLLRDDDDGGSL